MGYILSGLGALLIFMKEIICFLSLNTSYAWVNRKLEYFLIFNICKIYLDKSYSFIKKSHLIWIYGSDKFSSDSI